MEKQEEIDFAKKVVKEANHSFLNKDDIISNFIDYNFLVNENKNIGFTSYLSYDREKKNGVLSFDGVKPVKEQQQILLINYCMFMLDNNMSIKWYYKDIPSKSALKRLSRYIVSASVDKEFGGDSFKEKEQGGIKK